mmetsp:Transcript_37768/g.72349  ORF Transcript_37768/g.72349 Transcript_37768/m.72349 type:complete len:258 (+) Transcript_37768:2492-3265(+)
MSTVCCALTGTSSVAIHQSPSSPATSPAGLIGTCSAEADQSSTEKCTLTPSPPCSSAGLAARLTRTVRGWPGTASCGRHSIRGGGCTSCVVAEHSGLWVAGGASAASRNASARGKRLLHAATPCAPPCSTCKCTCPPSSSALRAASSAHSTRSASTSKASGPMSALDEYSTVPMPMYSRCGNSPLCVFKSCSICKSASHSAGLSARIRPNTCGYLIPPCMANTPPSPAPPSPTFSGVSARAKCFPSTGMTSETMCSR